MLDIGWSELLIVALVLIIVVGPKDLPRLMSTFGRYAGKLRRMAGDFQRQFEQAMRESEIDEMRKSIESVRKAVPAPELDKPMMLPKETAPAPEPGAQADKPAMLPEEAAPGPDIATKPKPVKPRKRAAAKAKPKLAPEPANGAAKAQRRSKRSKP